VKDAKCPGSNLWPDSDLTCHAHVTTIAD